MRYLKSILYFFFPSLQRRKSVDRVKCRCKKCGCDPETGRYPKPLLKG